MKLLLVCLLLPAALAAPSDTKRLLFGNFQIQNPFDVEMLKCDVQIMLDTLGTDPTEQACESECHKLLAEGNVMHFGCPLVCHGFQNLALYFHETPKPGEQHAHCGGLSLSTTVSS
ncbi:uncharacterized protein LOC132742399 [Ruditapes philippinarum]|uniref:uncharacterized protein LOC132713649 n=1 Tax=Ruditapes philippinarum TaxID=129788 RepID=UPI00295AE57E|nr:uncharacterized protein LOC132713649 [Ruditapes philippinarum]XP_060586797.1 uncharacterized protein LOC132742399 [Ruditapes philippinarum]